MRTKLLTAFAATALIAVAPVATARASVTLGQLAPVTSNPIACTGGDVDFAQPTVASGNSYVVPAIGTITSWSHSARSGAGQEYIFKVWRKVADPATFQVVGHDGPRLLSPTAINTFPANIAVRPGDFIGFHGAAVNHFCSFAGDAMGTYQIRNPSNLNDGESGAFTTFGPTNNRLNISAVFNPTNTFTLGAITRNKKKGTATIIANLPNPGELTAAGKGVKASGAAVTSKAVGAGVASLTIRAKGKKKHKLNDRGKVKLNAAITYTPTGGDPSTQSRKVKLKKNP